MNYKISLIIFTTFFFSSTSCVQIEEKVTNQLNWVEISHNKLSVQIMFDFSQKVDFTPTIIKEKNQLLLSFPGMTSQTFQMHKIVPKLNQLKVAGLLKSVEYVAQPSKAAHVNLTLEFARERATKNNKDTNLKLKKHSNHFLIKWSTLEQPYRLIIDIFPKENLEKITQKDPVLLYAKNDTHDDNAHLAQRTKDSTSKQQRIIIDPGHGGSETGTKGYFGLVEKDITLDLGKKVHKLLKLNGYKSLLTRHDDRDISLLERAQFAHQLQADLFVSIHVNSSGSMGCSAWGIETFFFNNSALQPHKGQTGFGFINTKDDSKLVERVQENLSQTRNSSQKLAQHVQNSIISTLSHNKIQTHNRGIKPEKFRVFVQTSIPATLVEVGFLTNKKEAARLNKQAYRNMLAQGIYKGIVEYLHNQ